MLCLHAVLVFLQYHHSCLVIPVEFRLLFQKFAQSRCFGGWNFIFNSCFRLLLVTTLILFLFSLFDHLFLSLIFFVAFLFLSLTLNKFSLVLLHLCHTFVVIFVVITLKCFCALNASEGPSAFAPGLAMLIDLLFFQSSATTLADENCHNYLF